MPIANIVAVYPSRSTAETARRKLIETGLAEDNIRLSSDRSMSDAAFGRTEAGEASGQGFFSWLFGENASQEDQAIYSRHVRGQGENTVVSVQTDDSLLDQIEAALEKLDPIDISESKVASAAPSQAGSTSTGVGRDPMMGGTTAKTRGDASNEQVIPIVEEKLNVGKQVVERRHRIRTRVIEQPVEQQVNLRDERVVVERRPVTEQSGTIDPASVASGDFEIVERHERPVVSKEGRVKEEVVVRKEASEHAETVRDTVKRTDVESTDDGKQSQTQTGTKNANMQTGPGRRD